MASLKAVLTAIQAGKTRRPTMFFGNPDRAMLREILQNTRTFMATAKDILAGVTLIVTDFTSYSTAVDAKLATLQATVATTDDPDLATAVKELTDLHEAFKPKIASLATTADVPVPPAIQPQPDVTVSGT